MFNMNLQKIFTFVQQLLTAPVFPDKETTRAARWLNFLLLTLIFLLAADSIAILLGILDQDAVGSILVINAVGLLIACGTFLLMRRGYVRIAALILLGALFVLITYTNASIFQSIRTPNTASYFVLIPLAGLLVGRRNMNIFATICMMTIAIVGYLELIGILIPQESRRSLFDDVFVWLITLIMNAVLLNASIRRVEEKAEEIRETAAALATANQELQMSQEQLQQARIDLEQKVQQRTQELRESNTRLRGEVEQRQRLFDALARSEANWRSLAEQVPEIIARIDRDHTISFINHSINDQTPDTLIGAHASAIHAQAQHQALLLQSIGTVFQTGETVRYESEEGAAADHTWRLNRVGAIHQDGEVAAVILISTDITEQKQTEAAMYQMQKLESLGILAGGVAHDFNNLLTAMLMQLSLAASKLAPDHPVHRHLQRTVNAAERATELTRQMLNYAGRTQSETQLLDLNDLITDNIHLFSASIPKSVSLTSQLGGDIPLMTGDKGQIQQLIMNLILNSADAIGQKAGRITVTTKIRELTEEDAHQWRWFGTPITAGRYVQLAVDDTGCGMDAQTLTKIFDPFFTTKFTGRGLGLASVIGIVRSHKGGLHVASTVGKGTTFTLLFPATTGEAPLAVSDAECVKLSGQGELVLVIDDEDIVREGMADTLTAAGLYALTAADGPTGLQLVHKYGQEIKLILLDLSMPGMSGEEVFEQLQALDIAIPILLVSGYSRTEIMERFVNTGLAGFIQKPYTADTFLQQVQSHLRLNAVEPRQEIVAP
ncbi:MAG: response regulator [Caldilineaceae bacterium]